MLDLAFIRENADTVMEALQKRKSDVSVAAILELDAERRVALVEVEGLKKTRNDSSKKIGQLIKEGGDVAAQKDEVKKIGARITGIETTLADIEGKLHSLSDFRGKKVFLATWASW